MREENPAGAGRKRYCPAQQIETAGRCGVESSEYAKNGFWVKSPCGVVRDENEFSRGREDPEEKPGNNLFTGMEVF